MVRRKNTREMGCNRGKGILNFKKKKFFLGREGGRTNERRGTKTKSGKVWEGKKTRFFDCVNHKEEILFL